jgi:DNA-binding transcriptional MerR regulator
VDYTVAQAARLSGCTVAQLRYWSRSDLVVPSGEQSRYSFRDLVALRVMHTLLSAGVPTARARLAVTAVRDAGLDLAGLRIVTDGRRVWACHDDGEILDALRQGQLALFVGVDRVADELNAAVLAFGSERAAFVEQLVTPEVATFRVS